MPFHLCYILPSCPSLIEHYIVLSQFTAVVLLKIRNGCGITIVKKFRLQIRQFFCDENVHLAFLTSRIQELAVKISDILVPISIVCYVTSTTIYI